MATLRRRIVPQFCRDLEGGLVLERHRPQLEQPQNDILGRRAPGNGPEDIPLPAIDLYIYIYWRRLSPHSRGDGRKAARAAFQSPTGNPCPSITEGRTLGVTPLNDTSVVRIARTLELTH